MRVQLTLLLFAAIVAGCGSPTEPEPKDDPTRAPPTSTPIRTPVTLASGSFTAPFGAIDIDVIGGGTEVSGDMHWSQGDDQFSVDLECSRTTSDGVILIGGQATHVTHPEMAAGDRVAIALRPAAPVEAILWAEVEPLADRCGAFLEGIPDRIVNDLQPVVGDVELGP